MKAQIENETPAKVIIKKVVNADPNLVFDAWTKPELMQEWLFPGNGRAKTTNELRVGGSYSHEMILKDRESGCSPETPLNEDGYASYPHYGEYLELSRPNKIVFTWNSLAVKNSRVTIDIRAVDQGSEITITHELLNSEELRKSHNQGWHECLENLVKRFS